MHIGSEALAGRRAVRMEGLRKDEELGAARGKERSIVRARQSDDGIRR